MIGSAVFRRIGARWVGLACLLAVGACDTPVAVSPVPDTHPAVQLAAVAENQKDFSEAALREELPFVCAGGEGRLRSWELCLLHSNGVTALVSFGDAEGITAVVTYPGSPGALLIPLDAETIPGIHREGGSISVSLQAAGREIGSIGSAALP